MMRTCGNCWWGPGSGMSAPCKAPVPGWIELRENEAELSSVMCSDDATDCPCWKPRWVKNYEGGNENA